MDSKYKTEISDRVKEADANLENNCKLHQEGSKLGGDFGMWSSKVVGYTPSKDSEEENTKFACMGELQFIDLLRSRQEAKCTDME